MSPPAVETRAPLPGILVGRYGEAQLAEGWHERERDGRFGIPYRATKETARLALRRRPAATQLHLLLSAPLGLMPERRLAGELRIGGARFELSLACELWVVRSFPLPQTDSCGLLEVALRAAATAVPDQVLKNGDARALGWFLSAAYQT